MSGIALNPNEFVLAELNRVQDGRRISPQFYNVVLTNERLIISKAGILGKDKFVYDKSLSDVKVFNDTAQVKVATVNGTQTKVDIYLTSDQISFKLNGAGHTDAIQFANALNQAVTGSDLEIYSISGNDTGASAFKKAFWGINSIEAKKQHNQKFAMRCSGCGATFEGIKGKTSKCPYCGSVYNS